VFDWLTPPHLESAVTSISVHRAATRPIRPSDPPVFYRLPAQLLTVRMSTPDGFDVIDRRQVDGAVVYGVAVWPGVAGPEADGVWTREERSAPVGTLIDLAVWPDTAPDGDGSLLPDAVDVRYRDGVETNPESVPNN
jgi:hypothetical protein